VAAVPEPCMGCVAVGAVLLVASISSPFRRRLLSKGTTP